MSDMSQVPTDLELERAAASAEQNFDVLAPVKLKLSVEVGSATLTLSELLSLKQGAVVELDRECDALLDICANGTLIAKGEVVSVDGRYGIKIVELSQRRPGSGFSDQG